MSSGLAHEQAGWELDAEHREFAAVWRAFTDRHVRPAVGEAEALGHLPPRLWGRELGAAGLLGLPVPAEHGGSGGDQLAVALLAVALQAEELARPAEASR
jgi:acyl-CoA dehydrogenase